MKKNRGVFLLFFLFTTISAFCQEDEIFSVAENEKYLSGKTAVLLVGIASESFDPAEPPRDLVSTLKKLQFGLDNLNPEEDITAGEFSLLVTSFFDIPGGIMYGLFKIPHYALKELQYLNLISYEYHSGQKVPGKLASQIVQEVRTLLKNGEIR